MHLHALHQRRHFPLGRIGRWATLVLVLILAGQAWGMGLRKEPQWVGTWAAAPMPRAVGARDHTFSNITLTQTVHTSIGGKQIRLQLTNEFGLEPLLIGGVRIAPTRTEAGVRVTFQGRATVNIPAGAKIISDPISFRLPPRSDLQIHLFVPEQTISILSFHSDAQQTNYLAPGNIPDATTVTGSRKLTSWYFLKQVDVVSPAKIPTAIVAFGDSITDGARSSIDRNQRWPDLLVGRLQASADTAEIAVLNEGIGGNRLLQDAGSPNALARFDRDVLSQGNVRYVALLEGINDLTHATRTEKPDERASAEDLIAALKQLVDRAHDHGMKIFGGTITPYEGTAVYNATGEEMRQTINQWIRTSGAFDAVIDFDKAVRDPARPERLLDKNDSNDHLHPGDEGYHAMASAFDLSLVQ